MAHDQGHTSTVVHVGPSPEQLGGMETVLRVYANASWPSFRMTVIASAVRGPLRRRLATVASACRALSGHRGSRFHFHVSHRGSFIREGILIYLASRYGAVHATIHGSDFVRTSRESRVWRWIYRIVLRKLSSVAVLNEDARNTLTLLNADLPVMITPNPGPVYPAPPSPTYENGATVVFAGRVGLRKGIDVLVEAWEIVRDTHPEARLVVMGPRDADLPHDVWSKVAEYYAGEQPPEAVQAQLREAACAVLPSRAEGQPMFLIEALAFGVPLVVTDVGGMPGLARDSGRIVPQDDPAALGRSIADILVNDESTVAMRKCALLKYQTAFSVEAHDQQLAKLYSLTAANEGK